MSRQAVLNRPGPNPARELARSLAMRDPGRPVHRRRPTRRQFAIRRLVAGTLALVVVGGLSEAVLVITGPGPTGHRAVTVKIPRSTSTTTPPAIPPEPGGGTTLFPSHRLVAFYGAPGVPRLGVLGTAPPEALWSQLTKAAAPFSSPDAVVVPSFELIAILATASPGADGSYATKLSDAQIDSYLHVVHANGGMLILDIQPGRGDLLADAQSLEPWLIEPDVGLALDPEWELAPGQRPGAQIGHTTAAEINQVSDWLQKLTVSHRLPQKLLIVHQFRSGMVDNKPDVTTQPNLAMAFNMDGFGTTAAKLSVYQLLAADTRWTLGYKLFYTRDKPLQAPADILALAPAPLIVEYE